MEKKYCFLYSINRKVGWFGQEKVVESCVVTAHKYRSAEKLFWDMMISSGKSVILEGVFVEYRKRERENNDEEDGE